MFGLFIMTSLWILVLGPGINEHGIKVIQDKGYKTAIVQALKEGETLTGGNYGNP